MQKLLILLEGGQEGSAISQIAFIGLIFVVFYFFMIRPQMKKQKTEKKFRKNLQKGDKVVTIGGIFGTIISMNEETVTLQVAENIKLKFDKNAIKPVA